MDILRKDHYYLILIIKKKITSEVETTGNQSENMWSVLENDRQSFNLALTGITMR